MKLRIISTLVVMLALAGLSSQSLAGPPDFSICDDLQGTALGLCQAGVAIGCASDGNSNSCAQIAEQFQQVTGEPPPYMVVTISPTSGFYYTFFTITDSDGRMEQGDFVIVFESRTDPLRDGYSLAEFVSVDGSGEFLTGRAGVPILPRVPEGEVTYFVRVVPLENAESLESRFGDLAFDIDLSCLPPCRP